jgi:heavy metal sensor kinase
MRALPIRLRLTFWYFVMFAAAALLLSMTSWWMLRRTLDATIRQDLQERVDDIGTQLHQLGPDVGLEAAQARFDAIYRHRDDGKWLQIIDADGHVLYRSARMMSLPSAVLRSMQSAAKSSVIDVSQPGHPVRMLATTLLIDGRAYFVEDGISMNKPRVLLHDFGLGLLLLTPGVLLLAAGGGHFMSRKALAPVALIAHEARRITERNLDKRLPVSPSDDELSHLSVTLNHMLARIDVAFRSVRDFTANASHELRTPLARLRTEAEIALFRPREADEYRQALENVHRDSVDMSGLLENLLALARAETGNEALRLSPVDLQPLLQSAAKEWLPIAERCSIRLHAAGFDLRENSEPLTVLGDRLSLLRLLRIWLDNACKFTPAGGTITIRVTPGAGEILLAVEDSGIGIAAQDQARIFDRFYRVHGDTGRQTAGAGLGLSLAALIAEQHQTRISVDSALDRGSSFEIRLVRARHNDPAEKATVSLRKNEERVVL